MHAFLLAFGLTMGVGVALCLLRIIWRGTGLLLGKADPEHRDIYGL